VHSRARHSYASPSPSRVDGVARLPPRPRWTSTSPQHSSRRRAAGQRSRPPTPSRSHHAPCRRLWLALKGLLDQAFAVRRCQRWGAPRRTSCAAARDGARRAGHRALLRETWLPPACTPRENGAVQASLSPRDAGPAGYCAAAAAAVGLLFVAGLPSPDRGHHRGGMSRSGREKRGALPPRQRPAGGRRAASRCGPSAEEGAAPLRPGEVSGGSGGLDHERDRGSRGGKIKMAGPTFGGENGGPPEMEGGRGNLEGYAKWRLV
jgi:hypothetical protein